MYLKCHRHHDNSTVFVPLFFRYGLRREWKKSGLQFSLVFFCSVDTATKAMCLIWMSFLFCVHYSQLVCHSFNCNLWNKSDKIKRMRTCCRLKRLRRMTWKRKQGKKKKLFCVPLYLSHVGHYCWHVLWLVYFQSLTRRALFARGEIRWARRKVKGATQQNNLDFFFAPHSLDRVACLTLKKRSIRGITFRLARQSTALFFVCKLYLSVQ